MSALRPSPPQSPSRVLFCAFYCSARFLSDGGTSASRLLEVAGVLGFSFLAEPLCVFLRPWPPAPLLVMAFLQDERKSESFRSL